VVANRQPSKIRLEQRTGSKPHLTWKNMTLILKSKKMKTKRIISFQTAKKLTQIKNLLSLIILTVKNGITMSLLS
jgi:hypothetical protein